MRYEAVPDYRLERFGVRRDARSLDGGHDDDAVAHLPGVAAIAPDHAEDLETAALRLLEAGDDIRAYVLLEIAAADREHEHRVLRVGAAGPEPRGEHRFPAFIVGARGEL